MRAVRHHLARGLAVRNEGSFLIYPVWEGKLAVSHLVALTRDHWSPVLVLGVPDTEQGARLDPNVAYRKGVPVELDEVDRAGR